MQDDRLAIELDFGENELITTIAQDAETDVVLMLAYATPEALAAIQTRVSLTTISEPRRTQAVSMGSPSKVGVLSKTSPSTIRDFPAVEPLPLESGHNLDVLFTVLEWIEDRIQSLHT